MYASRRAAVLLAFLLAVGTPAAARAAVTLRLGADYHTSQIALFGLTLGVTTPLARSLTVGGRFGGFASAPSLGFGATADLELHLNLGRVYLEGLVGPWLFFNSLQLVPHGAFGFGLHAGAVTFGVELGWAAGAMAGLRLAWRI